MATATTEPESPKLPIRRNIALLSAAEPWERASLLGLNDLLSGATGAGLTLLGGVALTAGGVAMLAAGAVALVTVPALWILHAGPRHALRFGSNKLGRRPCTPS
jgi:hypothetical protein